MRLNKILGIILLVVLVACGLGLFYAYSQKMIDMRLFRTFFVGALIVCIAIFIGINYLSSELSRKNKGSHDRPNRSTSNELGSGDMAKADQIQQWLKRTGEQDTVLPIKNLKGGDGAHIKSGELVIPREQRNRHMLIIAKTGGGKTSKLILPVLYSDCLCPVRSTIVLDSKPEMWSKLASMTAKYNPEKNIMLFNPLDKLRSLSWNIIGKIEDDTDAKLIANTLIMATDVPGAKADTPFFRNNALQLLNALMVGLLRDPGEQLSMPRVHELVHCGMKNLCDWLEAHPESIRNTRTFVDLARSGSQNADTIMSELAMRLSAWDLSAIRATTFMEELNLEDLISKPSLFIIELRESEIEMLRPMANVLIIEILRYLTKRAEQMPSQTLPRPVGLVIDEFASALGRLPDIHVKLNTLRSRNVSIVAAIQSIAQIKANYDTDADPVLAGFNTKILMPTLDFQDSEWASKESGTMTVRFNVASSGKNRRMVDYFAHRNTGLQEQVQQRAVLTPDEIGRPMDNCATFFLPGTPVFQGDLIPFYKIPQMLERLSIGEKEGVLNIRESPIQEKVDIPPPVSTETTDEQQDQGELIAQLEEARLKIGWDKAEDAAREWWVSFEEANSENLNMVLTLIQELDSRRSTIGEFFNALIKSGRDKIPEILQFLDDQILVTLKTQVGWHQASGPARQWWESFEKANEENLISVMTLCRDLLKRDATIDEFFDTYASIETESVEDVLLHLEVNRDELEAQKRRQHKMGRPSVGDDSVEKGSHDEIDDKIDDELLAELLGSEAKTLEDIDNFDIDTATFEEVDSVDSDRDELLEPVSFSEPEEDPQSDTSLADQVVKQTYEQEPKEQEHQDRAVHLFAGKEAAKNLHLASYFEMGEDFLKRGLEKDFIALIAMAQEDSMVSSENVSQLIAMGAKYGVTA